MKTQKHKLILEDREGKNLAKARHYLQSNGYSPEQSQKAVDSIRTDIPNSRLQQCKFILGVARLYLSGQLSDGQSIAELNKTLKYLTSDAHVNEYDYNLNNESLQVLVNRFKGVARDDLQQSMDKSNARQLTVNQDYNIIPIDNADEAAKYGRYTSWCVTHDPDMYNSYTNNGTGRFYFCLRNGFEKEPKVKGEGCPLDSYGLSMIAVSVTMEGEVNTITCRWNHDMNGNDNIMTIEQLEDLLGRNFYQTFKPYTREELHAKGIILFDEVQGLLDSGKKPEDIFDDCGDFYDGFAWVELNHKINFINQEGRLISNQWFDDARDFDEGFAWVYLNGKCNFINKEGKLLSNQWFDLVGDFSDGFARVYLNGKCNFINKEGRLISNQWFVSAGKFYNGFAVVLLNGKWCKINTRGEIVESKNRNKKTIVITEEQKKFLKENILMDKLPEDIMNSIFKNKTSLKNNPALPSFFDDNFIEKICKKRFEEIKKELQKIVTIDDVEDTDIETVLAKLIIKCQKLEQPFRNELEKLVFNYVVKFFNIPEDTVTMNLKLVDTVDIDTSVINVEPSEEEIEYEDLRDIDSLKDEIYKRRLLDVLSAGFGMQTSANIKSYINDIYDINPKLADLYTKILALNNYLLFVKEDMGITDKTPMQMGNVIVKLGQPDETVVIDAQAMIFPVLLAETMRGFMELFASHGLPKDKNKMETIIGKADYLKAEPWDMRLGPSLWIILSDTFENVDSELLPYLYKRIAMLSPKSFNNVMSEVFAKTRKGKMMIAKIAAKARRDMEYDKFSDKMQSLQTDKNLINDEFINEDEL